MVDDSLLLGIFIHLNIAYLTTINYNIVQLTKEGLGIRSTAS